MRTRIQPWQLAAIVILLCGSILWFAHWRSTSRPYGAAELIQCLPPEQATHMFIDVAALRSSGILDLLAGSRAAEEADYKKFVDQTGFDYRTDLDAVAGAFGMGELPHGAGAVRVEEAYRVRAFAGRFLPQCGLHYAGQYAGAPYFVLSAAKRCSGAGGFARGARDRYDRPASMESTSAASTGAGLDFRPVLCFQRCQEFAGRHARVFQPWRRRKMWCSRSDRKRRICKSASK